MVAAVQAAAVQADDIIIILVAGSQSTNSLRPNADSSTLILIIL